MKACTVRVAHCCDVKAFHERQWARECALYSLPPRDFGVCQVGRTCPSAYMPICCMQPVMGYDAAATVKGDASEWRSDS